ncbi:MAG: hypothetical protein ACJ731_09760, partial [Vicinamibacterales bacterium]
LSTLIKDHLAGGASRLTALRLPQILPVFSVDAPCHPGAALRDLVLVHRGQTTSPTYDVSTLRRILLGAAVCDRMSPAIRGQTLVVQLPTRGQVPVI